MQHSKTLNRFTSPQAISLPQFYRVFYRVLCAGEPSPCSIHSRFACNHANYPSILASSNHYSVGYSRILHIARHDRRPIKPSLRSKSVFTIVLRSSTYWVVRERLYQVAIGHEHPSFDIINKTHVRHRLIIISTRSTDNTCPAYLCELRIAESRVIEVEDGC